MSKLGCSLSEAFGESWSAGPKYYQTQPERFRVIDPYSTNVFTSEPQEIQNKETFAQDLQERENRIKMLEAKVDRLTTTTNKTEQFTIPLPNLSECSERIDNVVRFALVSILVSNFIDLMSSSTN